MGRGLWFSLLIKMCFLYVYRHVLLWYGEARRTNVKYLQRKSHLGKGWEVVKGLGLRGFRWIAIGPCMWRIGMLSGMMNGAGVMVFPQGSTDCLGGYDNK